MLWSVENNTQQCHLGRDGCTKSDEFSEKFQRGGGVIFNPKIYVVDFGNFKQAILNMKLIRKSNFSVQGMFFNNCIEKNQNKTHFEEGSSSHTSLRDGSRYQIG